MANFSSTTIISSTIAPEEHNIVLGLICTVITSIGFGTNYIPIKKFDTGDGMFFQLVVCTAIWITGLCANIIRGSPELYPLVMTGGIVWATANILIVPILKTIGLGMGVSIWASTSTIIGWASGRFGWFGMKPEPPASEVLNYLGLVCVFIRAFIFIYIKPEVAQNVGNEHAHLNNGTSGRYEAINSETEFAQHSVGDKIFVEKLPSFWQRVIGVFLACLVGVCFGLTFVPAIYIQDRYPGSSQNGLDYAFAHFCGILATGWFYFIIYCIVMKNKPKLYPEAILPGVLSGIIWAIAQLAFFVANKTLNETITFPIIGSLPCLIAALCSVFIFGEIKGRKNFVLLTVAFIVTFGGAALSTLSI